MNSKIYVNAQNYYIYSFNSERCDVNFLIFHFFLKFLNCVYFYIYIENESVYFEAMHTAFE